MVLTDRAYVCNLAWTVFGKWLNVMKLDIIIIFNRVIINEAIENTVPPLLRQNLFLLRIRNLSLEGRHCEPRKSTKWVLKFALGLGGVYIKRWITWVVRLIPHPDRTHQRWR